VLTRGDLFLLCSLPTQEGAEVLCPYRLCRLGAAAALAEVPLHALAECQRRPCVGANTAIVGRAGVVKQRVDEATDADEDEGEEEPGDESQYAASYRAVDAGSDGRSGDPRQNDACNETYETKHVFLPGMVD